MLPLPPNNPSHPSSGLNQNTPNYHLPYYPPPNNSLNTLNNPHLYDPSYKTQPHPNQNYFSGGSNSIPSFTPTGSIPDLGHFRTDIDSNTNEGLRRQCGGVGGIIFVREKCTVEEDW